MIVPATPKYLQISQELEGRIRGGQWKSKIPSVRGIAVSHGVSVVTAARALQVLRDKGLISAVERSGCYLLDAARGGAERWAICLRITPGPFQAAVDLGNRRGFEAIARSDGISFDPQSFRIDENTSDRELLRQARRAADNGIGGVVLLPSRLSDSEAALDERLLAACDAARLPVVLIERNLRGRSRPLVYDLVASDDVAGGRTLTRHLLDGGRKRIACVIASPCSTHDDRLAGYLTELNLSDRCDPLVFTDPLDKPRKVAYSRLTDLILHAKCDGVVCYQDYTAIGLILELLARGLRVPKDVAVAGFDDLPIGNQFAIGVTTYAFPAERVAREALALLRRRQIPSPSAPIRVVVPGELIVRESTGGGGKP